MSILRKALRVIKWNRIPTFKDLNVLEVVLAIPLQEKYVIYKMRQHGSKMHVHACVIFLGY